MTLDLIAGIFLLMWASCTANSCPKEDPIREFDVHEEKNPSVFDDLTTSEIQNVYDYLRARPEFDIKHGDDIRINSTYVFNIERRDAPKAEVLAYLDGTGRKPDRMAWVVMYRGDQTPAVIEEYVVGPLPEITGLQKLTIAGKDSVDYIRRLIFSLPDMASWQSVINRETAKVDHILKRITGFTVNNCTDRCLIWVGTLPAKENDRSMWVTMLKKVEQFYLHPIGLQFRIRTSNNLNPDDWTVDYVWFRKRVYQDFNDMLEQYPMETKPDPYVNYDDTRNLYSSLHHRGEPLPETRKRGPQAFMPDGRRYTVDGHRITWQGWSFDFNVRSVMGLHVHDVQFRKERIAYELSLSEVGIVYSGASPFTLHSAFVDSSFSLGLLTFELLPGVDCPDYATYFDFAHYYYGEILVNKRSVCVFEHNRGIPIRHHYDINFAGGYNYIQGMPGNVLVLRSVITVYNYEYIMDYVFHQNGVLEVVVSLSGYILSSYYTGNPTDDSRGFEVFPGGMGQIHNHWLHFKADLDIGQTRNRFETLDIGVETVQDPTDSNNDMYVQRFKRNLRMSEKNATYRFNFDTPKYLVFSNNDAQNKYGNNKGYRLIPVHMNKQPLPEDWPMEKGLSFERNQVVVTRHKDEEKRGSSEYNELNFADPIVNFLDFIEDDEPIVDEDLVAWVTLGAFHIPHSEDIPIVQTPSLSLTYFLQPYNFFDEDPSLASRDNIRVTPREDGSAHFEYAGDPPSNTCAARSLAQLMSSKAAAPTAHALGINMLAFVLLLVQLVRNT